MPAAKVARHVNRCEGHRVRGAIVDARLEREKRRQDEHSERRAHALNHRLDATSLEPPPLKESGLDRGVQDSWVSTEEMNRVMCRENRGVTCGENMRV